MVNATKIGEISQLVPEQRWHVCSHNVGAYLEFLIKLQL